MNKVEQYFKLEQEIIQGIEKLNNYGTDCSCGECNNFSYIFHGEYPEIITICLNCGGNIWDR